MPKKNKKYRGRAIFKVTNHNKKEKNRKWKLFLLMFKAKQGLQKPE